MVMSRTEKIVAIVVFGPILIGALLFWRIRAGVCQSETLQTISDLNGIKVETVYTNCDALAKSEQIDVYLSDAHPSVWATFWMTHREAIFSYDPSSYEDPNPTIQVVGPNRILLSVHRVSSIVKLSRTWRNISIEYKIDQVQYQ
jgi:hypothetical protein